MTLLVCPLAFVESAAVSWRPSHAVSLLAPDQDDGLAGPGPVLRLRFHDLSGPRDGFRPPDRNDMQKLLHFAADWDDAKAPLLVHCWFGISRSPAAAFAIMCQCAPDAPEHRLAETLRRLMPFATPNRLMIALADDILGRGGRMVEAIDGIGRGQGLFTGSCIDLPVAA